MVLNKGIRLLYFCHAEIVSQTLYGPTAYQSVGRIRDRDCESIYVGEALASNSRLKPLPHNIKTMTYKIKKLFLCCCHHNTFTVSTAIRHTFARSKTIEQKKSHEEASKCGSVYRSESTLQIDTPYGRTRFD